MTGHFAAIVILLAFVCAMVFVLRGEDAGSPEAPSAVESAAKDAVDPIPLTDLKSGPVPQLAPVVQQTGQIECAEGKPGSPQSPSEHVIEVVERRTGRPIPGAQASVLDLEAVTNTQGIARIRGVPPSGVRVLTVQARGFEWVQLTLVGSASETRVRLRCGAVIVGVVRTALGQPLPDAHVAADVSRLSWRSTGGGTGKTRADGRYVIEGLAARQAYSLEVRLQGRQAARAGRVATPETLPRWNPDEKRVVWQSREAVVLEPGERRRIDILVGRTGTVRGRILDAHRRPVNDVLVGAIDPSARSEDSPCPVVVTEVEQDGTFLLERVPVGRWAIVSFERAFLHLPEMSLRLEEQSPARTILEVGESLSYTVELVVPARFIEGRIEGPLDCCVDARNEEETHATFAVPGRDGQFRIGPLFKGLYHVWAGEDGWESAHCRVEAGTRGVVLRVPGPLVPLEGKVIDAAMGKPCYAELDIAYDHGVKSKRFVDGPFATEVLPGRIDILASTREGRLGRLQGLTVDPTHGAKTS